MPRGKPKTSTPVKESYRLNTSEDIRNYNELLSDLDYSPVETDPGSENEQSDPDNTIEMEEVIGDTDSDRDTSDDEMAAAPEQGSMNVFAWSNTTRFEPNIPVFDSENSGIQAEFPVIDEEAEEVEYFMAYFDREVMDLMCVETNKYQVFVKEKEREQAQQREERERDEDASSQRSPSPPSQPPSPQPGTSADSLIATPTPRSPRPKRPRTRIRPTRGRPTPEEPRTPTTSRPPSSASRASSTDTPPPSRASSSDPHTPASSTSGTGQARVRPWVEVTVKEMYVFLALLMLMSHVKKAVIKEYWSVSDLTSTPIFAKFMTRDRFMSVLRYVHFVDNNTEEERKKDDRLWKMRDFFTMLREKFQRYFFPFQKMVIDESLVLFRGRVSFRQYIPLKRHRFGIKFFVICDCQTGYVLGMIVYTASDVDIPKDKDVGFSGAVVKKLMDKYLNKNHILYTDNYYTSPTLSKFLLENNTGSCGTVRSNRKHYPKFTKGDRNEVKLKKSGDMLALSWCDRRQVNMLTTVHKGKMVETEKRDRITHEKVKKPDAVVDYNINMRLVDKSDMQIGAIECVRKCVKWYKKMFMHLLDISILNAYHMWLLKSGKRSSLRVFQKNVIDQLLSRYGTVQPVIRRRHHRRELPDRLLAQDYIARHFLEAIPPTPGRQKAQRKCLVCLHTAKRERKRKDVTTWCKECAVPLCLPCFRDYHTLKVY